VGPESAGADPGPACYGRGGPATVTDALVVLGRLPLERLAGGAVTLDRAAAERALARLARDLGLAGARAAAEGVVRIAEAHIEGALRKVSVERGHDPRGAALVAFGGAGGLHACAVAAALGCDTVVAPRHAGLLSALGALAGGARREASRSVLLDARDRAGLERAWRELEDRIRAAFPSGQRRRLAIERWAEARYPGQAHELSIPGGRDLAARFHREHERRYGFAEPDRTVEVVTIEARGALPGAPVRVTAPAASRARPRRAVVWEGGRAVRAAVWDREALGARFAARGPAAIVESGATLWVPPGWSARAAAGGALVLTRGRR
jgi:N-methylhydantoinase A